jgi:hypothetical protein
MTLSSLSLPVQQLRAQQLQKREQLPLPLVPAVLRALPMPFSTVRAPVGLLATREGVRAVSVAVRLLVVVAPLSPLMTELMIQGLSGVVQEKPGVRPMKGTP